MGVVNAESSFFLSKLLTTLVGTNLTAYMELSLRWDARWTEPYRHLDKNVFTVYCMPYSVYFIMYVINCIVRS